MNEIETENRGIAALLHGYYRNRNKDWIKDKMTKRQKLRQTIDRANMSMPVAMSIAMTLTIHFPFHFGLSWWCNFLEERDLRFTREVHRIVGRRVGGRRAQFGRCRSWIYKKNGSERILKKSPMTQPTRFLQFWMHDRAILTFTRFFSIAAINTR